jgi:hypothetical protein
MPDKWVVEGSFKDVPVYWKITKSSLQVIADALRIVHSGGSYMSPSIARKIVNHLMGGRVS